MPSAGNVMTWSAESAQSQKAAESESQIASEVRAEKVQDRNDNIEMLI